MRLRPRSQIVLCWRAGIWSWCTDLRCIMGASPSYIRYLHYMTHLFIHLLHFMFYAYRHLVSRIIDQCSKTSELYTEFAKKAHGAITGDTMIVYSRNGSVCFNVYYLLNIRTMFCLCVIGSSDTIGFTKWRNIMEPNG